jgi:mono/diheme cytochrome c family protein
MKRRFWWQRFHPVVRVLVAVVYFGSALSLIAYSIAQGSSGSGAVVGEPSIATTAPTTEPPTASTTVTPTTLPAPDLSGAELYAASCASCHGAALEGGIGPELDRGSEASEASDGRYVLRINEGKAEMPGFAGQLSSTEIDEIIAHIREQQGG